MSFMAMTSLLGNMRKIYQNLALTLTNIGQNYSKVFIVNNKLIL